MIPLSAKTNIDTTNPSYQYGKLIDDPGNGTGTPVNEQLYNDHHQFFERLMDDAGINANGLPDNDANGYQLNTALDSRIDFRAQQKVDARTLPTVSTVTPYLTIFFNAANFNKLNRETVQSGTPAKVFVYDFTGAVVGAKTRVLFGPAQGGSTLSVPDANTLKAPGFPTSFSTIAMIEFQYIGQDSVGTHRVTAQFFLG